MAGLLATLLRQGRNYMNELALVITVLCLIAIWWGLRLRRKKQIQKERDSQRKPEWRYITRLAHRWYRGQQLFALGEYQNLEEATAASKTFDDLYKRGAYAEAETALGKHGRVTESRVEAWYRFSELPAETHLQIFLQDHPELADDPDYRRWSLDEFQGLREVWGALPQKTARGLWREVEADRQTMETQQRRQTALAASRHRAEELRKIADEGD